MSQIFFISNPSPTRADMSAVAHQPQWPAETRPAETPAARPLPTQPMTMPTARPPPPTAHRPPQYATTSYGEPALPLAGLASTNRALNRAIRARTTPQHQQPADTSYVL